MHIQFSKGISGGLLGLAAAVCAVAIAGCGAQKTRREPLAQVQLKNMSNAEAHADFLQLTQSLRDQYGPLQYKQACFHFDFEKLAAASLAEIDAASTDLEYFGIMAKFLGNFHDGHVSFRVPLLSAVPFRSVYVPIALTHVAGKALVEWVDTGALAGIDVARGYELVSIDGQEPMALAAQLAQYQSSGNDESDKMKVFSAFYRGSYMGPFFPKSPTVNATFRRADGSLVTHALQWRAKNDQLADVPDASPAGNSHDLQGVQPDIAYEHTVEDFRAGFVNYVQTFSDRAVEMVAP